MRRTQAGFRDGANELAPDLLVRLGPTVHVDVGFRPAQIVDGVPDLPLKRLRALIDTGAGDSCIDAGIAERAGLPVIDERICSGIGGATRVNMYLGRIYVPTLTQLLFQSFAGVELESGGQWHQVLLGRTFLRPYVLTYDGRTGQVEINDGDAGP
jgi:hypothetical protein